MKSQTNGQCDISVAIFEEMATDMSLNYREHDADSKKQTQLNQIIISLE